MFLTEQSPALLNVENSVRGFRWHDRNQDPRLATVISQRLSVPDLTGRLLAARGICADNAKEFLDPKLRDFMPDPSQLVDMDQAVTRLVAAIAGGEKIAIFGDYDVDGATSSALLKIFLSHLGVRPEVYIPDRIREGYGPTVDAFQKLHSNGAKVVLTVDCGTSAHDALAAALRMGLDVVVLDHHTVGPDLPGCYALVNPNRLDDQSKQGALAAVGVTYLFLVALNRALRRTGYYQDTHEPDLMSSLDLVALGTVCDMVPLRDLNRALVRQGLKVLAKRGNKGLAALADVAAMDEHPNCYHLGFLLGPRINAGGRVGASDLGYRLLTENESECATDIAARLNVLNLERRTIESLNVDQAFKQLEEYGPPNSAIVVDSPAWHAGVIGLVASRLTERFKRPSFVIAFDGDVGKGSARSVPDVDVGAIITAACQNKMLLGGGGHPMAAGFTIDRLQLDVFREFVEKRVSKGRKLEGPPSLSMDGVLALSAVGTELMDTFEQVGPYGPGNPSPRFAFANVRVVRADTVGDGKHVRCIFAGDEGSRLKGVAFRAGDAPLGHAVLSARRLHVAGSLHTNHWRGRDEVELFIEDVAYPEGG